MLFFVNASSKQSFGNWMFAASAKCKTTRFKSNDFLQSLPNSDSIWIFQVHRFLHLLTIVNTAYQVFANNAIDNVHVENLSLGNFFDCRLCQSYFWQKQSFLDSSYNNMCTKSKHRKNCETALDNVWIKENVFFVR